MLTFRATLEPDGQGGRRLEVERKLREAAGAEAGDIVWMKSAPATDRPETRGVGRTLSDRSASDTAGVAAL